jgi:flagellar biosynthetic protein FlhB
MTAALVLVAAVDVPFQVWSHRRNLRMTRQELLDELKQTEGRPEVRSRVRAAQRELARRRMMQDVPRADVVVTNPTHYSVALRYEPGRMRAPRVLAKGRDLVALEIRRVAAEHGVPLFEAPPLARAIYATTEIGRDIPSGLYLAVAQVLTYVYQLRAARGDAARVRRPAPEVPAEFLVP